MNVKPEKWAAMERAVGAAYGNIAGIAVLEDGEAQYEKGFGDYSAASPVHVFSVTKSVVSALVGIAIGKGMIEDAGQKVLDFFPGYTPKRGEKTIRQVRIGHLLSMTAPYKYRSAPYTKYFSSENWVTAALDLLGGRGPLGVFRYTPLIGPDILTGILARAAGRPVLDFAREHLFSPLGIEVKGSVTFRDKDEQFAFLRASGPGGWVADPMGTHTAGWGLCLSATDMAKIGQLYLSGGQWKGRQILPAGWTVESTKEHSRWEALGLGYGYLWWRLDDAGLCYAAMGDCGNMIYVNTKRKLVAAIASLYRPSAKDRIAFIREFIDN